MSSVANTLFELMSLMTRHLWRVEEAKMSQPFLLFSVWKQLLGEATFLVKKSWYLLHTTPFGREVDQKLFLVCFKHFI